MGTRSKQTKALEAKHRLKTLSGRQRKALAMDKARELAERGGFSGFSHVLASLESEDPDAASTLRIWAGGTDISSIDMVCAKWLRAQPKRRR